jgi:hypothetical protein
MEGREGVPLRPYVTAAVVSACAIDVLLLGWLVYSLSWWSEQAARGGDPSMWSWPLGVGAGVGGLALSAYVPSRRLQLRVLPEEDPSAIHDPSELEVRHRWMLDERTLNRWVLNNPIALSVLGVACLLWAPPVSWGVSALLWRKATRIGRNDAAGRTPDPTDDSISRQQ